MSRDRARASADSRWAKQQLAGGAKTERAELLAALRGLAEYAGGSDAPPGHPCRVAWDTLAKYEPKRNPA